MKQKFPSRSRSFRSPEGGKKPHDKRPPRPSRDYAGRSDRPEQAEGGKKNFSKKSFPGRSRPFSAPGEARTRYPDEAKKSFGKRPFRPSRDYAGRSDRPEQAEGGKKNFSKKSFPGRSRPFTAPGEARTRYPDEAKKSFGKRPPRPSRDHAARSDRPETSSRTPRDSKPYPSKPYKARTAPKEFSHRRERTAPQASVPRPSAKGVLIWGLHAVREALLNPKRRCYKLWTTEAGEKALALALTAVKDKELNRPAPTTVERSEIDLLLPTNSVHQGVALDVEPLAPLEIEDITREETRPDLVVVLDQVTDPHNIGAILRSAAAFGAGAVIMTERHAPNTTGVMAKTACGAMEHVPVIHVVNLSRAVVLLQQAGFWCVGLAEEGARDLGALDLSGPTALLLGAEGEGLRRLTREMCDELARLPTSGAIGSLNVSNAAAVALYEVRRQKGKFKAAP